MTRSQIITYSIVAICAVVIALLVTVGTTPCATEDSNMCVWLATRQGNGVGHSFVAVFDIVFYLS